VVSLLLDIITITKDDLEGFISTIESTRAIRENFNVKQIIIDSSNEDIKEKIFSLLSDEKNINYYWCKPSGRSAAFNYGLSFSDAKWVWFLNGGDRLHPNLDIENFYKLLSYNNSDAIIFQLQYTKSSATYRHPSMWALWPPLLSWIPHPSSVTQRGLFKEFGPFDESLKIAMDYEFWIRCFSKDVIVDLISIPVALFDETGISNMLNKETRKERRRIIRKYFWPVVKIWFLNGLIILRALKTSSKFQRNKS
jgi:glycosyltransferase involved in cell wall biosynthesis